MTPVTVAEAYEVCRETAKREAKNFYYAFRVLPREKSDAMCAIYAFMRRADDLADDESLSLEERRTRMAEWVAAWRAARSAAAQEKANQTEDPIFLALNDTQHRFNIPDQLLEELVQGTTMDLEPQAASGPASDSAVDSQSSPQTFATFNDLYRYCYLVASVVGLVTIRVFGYSDPRAEKLAEETGVAFQLTNILRDVKEDAERGRLYLPLDMLAHFKVSEERIRALVQGAPMEARERSLLGELGNRAELYYASADRLLPLIDTDSRAALWVLVTIYHGLLKKIERAGFEVFDHRISVPTSKKLGILAQGAAMSLGNRVLA